MTPLETLLKLLARVGASRDAAALVSDWELSQWPETAVRALKSQNLLARSSPANTAVCPGCEQECTMQVHTIPGGSGKASSFVMCDKRNDIGRVDIPLALLTQWRCSANAVGAFVAGSLGLRPESPLKAVDRHWELGLATGKKRNQMLCLRANGVLELVAGSNSIPLADMVLSGPDGYSVDREQIERLVDASNTGDSRYTPSNVKREARKLKTQDRYDTWRKERRNLKSRHPEWSDSRCAELISKMDIAHGCDPETIRKHLKK